MNAAAALKPWSAWVIVLSGANEFMNAAGRELAETPTSNQILQKILDTTREGVVVVDANMCVAHCNVPAAVAFGRDSLDLETRRLSEVIRDLDLHEAFRKAITSLVTPDVPLHPPPPPKRHTILHPPH